MRTALKSEPLNIISSIYMTMYQDGYNEALYTLHPSFTEAYKLAVEYGKPSEDGVPLVTIDKITIVNGSPTKYPFWTNNP